MATDDAGPTAPSILPSSQGQLVVAHTRRTMKAYSFTDSDIETISLTNLISGVAFSFAAAVGAFCIDINKDVIMASEDVSPAGLALQFTVNWIGVPFVAILVVVGLLAQIKRGSVIARVKRESENT